MNKKLISAAVMLGVSGAATAVNVNSDGLGQVLLYPYYTANNGLTTAIHIVNTTADTKAVKVRFNEGGNTWEIRDFNLYMSPYDSWSASVSMGEDGQPVISTNDTSCVITPFDSNGQKTVDDFNIVTFGPDQEPTYLTNLDSTERMSEGHIEVIEMGVITKDSEEALAIEHDADGVPANCALLTESWESNAGGDDNWNANRSFNVGVPSGGLMGTADIISVENGIDRGYDATAISNFWDVDGFTADTENASAHVRPGTSYPNLNGDIVAADDNTPTTVNAGSKVANVFDNATSAVVDATFGTTAEALTATLMVDTVYNEYIISDGLAAATDWVLTFPTKHIFVNPDSTQSGGQTGQFGLLAGPIGSEVQVEDSANPGAFVTQTVTGAAPFADGFQVPITINAYDREEQTFRGGSTTCDSPCSAAPGLTLDYEVNVLEFAADRNVFGSNLATKTVPQDESGNVFKEGWAAINLATDTDNQQLESTGTPTVVFSGQPVIGFASLEAKNGTGDKALRNYASIYMHKYHRTITTN